MPRGFCSSAAPVPTYPADMEYRPATLVETIQAQDVHSQDLSPLFNKIPSEIRNLIFEYAFTEYPAGPLPARHFAVQMNHDEAPLPAEVNGNGSTRANLEETISVRNDWIRPDFSVSIPTDLLRTCKRIYLETYSLPTLQKEFRFYFYRGPKAQPDPATQADFEKYFNQTLAEWSPVPNHRRLDLVRSIRLFTQMFWLEDRGYRNLFWLSSQTYYFFKVENLRMTFRRCDWWWWEQNTSLSITPFRGNSSHQRAPRQMKADMAETFRGGRIPFSTGVWGLAFERMPKLRTLIMDFETSEDKKHEMEKIVEWAQHWKFPAASGSGGPAMCFSAAGMPVQKMSWIGLPHHWSDKCTVCASWTPRVDDCSGCAQKARFQAAGYGPRLLLWTVTWKLARDDGASHETSHEA